MLSWDFWSCGGFGPRTSGQLFGSPEVIRDNWSDLLFFHHPNIIIIIMRPAGAWIMLILYTVLLNSSKTHIFDILLSTPTFHILDAEPPCQVGLVSSRLFRQHRFATRQAQQTSSVSFITMVIIIMIVLFDVRCINIAAWQRLVLSLLCLCWLAPHCAEWPLYHYIVPPRLLYKSFYHFDEV